MTQSWSLYIPTFLDAQELEEEARKHLIFPKLQGA